MGGFQLIFGANILCYRYYPDWDEMCKTMDLNTHIPKPKPEENDKAKEVTEEVKEEEKSVRAKFAFLFLCCGF